MRYALASATMAVALSALASHAHAALITYANVGTVAANGIEYSNIYESNDLATPNMVFGQPTFNTTSGGLIFPTFEPANITSTSSDGGGSSVSVFLSFDVTLKTAIAPAVFESEFGDFTQLNLGGEGSGGTGKVSGLLTLLDLNNNVLNISSLGVTPNEGVGAGVFTTDPVGPPSGLWNASASVVDSASLTTFRVQLENNLQTIASPTGTVLLDKKNVTFLLPGVVGQFTPPPSPEPASLGLLAMGALALVGRRKR